MIDPRVTAVSFLNPTEDVWYQPKTEQKVPVKDTFDSVFSAAMDVIKETNNYQLRANQTQNDLAAGRTDDILSVLLAQDRAYSTLNFTVQVTNKIIESYREIMRMQI